MVLWGNTDRIKFVSHLAAHSSDVGCGSKSEVASIVGASVLPSGADIIRPRHVRKAPIGDIAGSSPSRCQQPLHMLSFPSSSLSRERLGTWADERRNSLRDRAAACRFTLVTLGVDLGDRRLETVGAV